MAVDAVGIEIRPDGIRAVGLSARQAIVRELEPSEIPSGRAPRWIGLSAPLATWAVENVPFTATRDVRRAAAAVIEPHLPTGDIEHCLADAEVMARRGREGAQVFIASSQADQADSLAERYGPLAGITATAVEVCRTLGKNGKLVVVHDEGRALLSCEGLVRELVVGNDTGALREEVLRTLDLAGLPEETPVEVYSEKPVDLAGLPATTSPSAKIRGAEVPASLIGASCAAARGLGWREDGLDLLRVRRSKRLELARKLTAAVCLFFLSAAVLLVVLGFSLNTGIQRYQNASRRLVAVERDAWSELFPGRAYVPGQLRRTAAEQAKDYVPDPQVKSALEALGELARRLPDVNKTGLVFTKLSITQEGFLLTGQVARGRSIPTENVSLIERALNDSRLLRAKAEEVQVRSSTVALRLKGTYR